MTKEVDNETLGMRLSELMASAEIALECGPDPLVTGITDDSRRVKQGDLFVGVRGERSDGREFYGAAVRAGAAALAGHGRAPGFAGVPFVALADDRSAASRLAAAFHGRPAERLKMFGVTGTNGKTTSVYILEAILAAAMLESGVLGTIRYSTGARTFDAALTTPGPVLLQELLAEMVGSGRKACAMEVSSHALAQRRVDGVGFDAVLVTNVTQDHFDYHGDFKSYLEAKLLMVDRLKSGGALIVNADDPSSHAFAARAPAHARVMRYALASADFADFRADIRAMDQNGTLLRIDTPEGPIDARTRLFGKHNVSNLLGAAAAAWSAGIPPAAITAGLAQIVCVPGRLERVDVGADITAVVDYAHTPDAVEKALLTLRPLVGGRLTVVFGCGGDRDKTKRPLMGRAAERFADRVYVTSDNPRGERAELIAESIVSGMEKPAAARVVLDRRTAIVAALDEAAPGDWVLIAGKGHESYQITAEGRQPFSDQKVALEWGAQRNRKEAHAS